MKKALKLALTVALAMSVSSLFAQKFGRINSQEIAAAMPETAEMQTNLEALSKELSDTYEAMRVELNTKFQELQKNLATMTDTMKDMKQKELQSIQERMRQFEAQAQEDIAKKQEELSKPIYEKLLAAIQKVSKENDYLVVFDTAIPTMVYFDEAQLIDIAPAVKAELGIQ